MMKRKLIAAGVASAFFIAGPVLAGGDNKATGADASVNSKTDTSASSSTSTPLPGASVSNDTSASVGASGESTSANEPQKKRGLDRADEAAGEHGKHGRDNARAKQERNAERQLERRTN
jgi:hypothetical protein